ncbi:MAG: 3-hydroxyacyl-CoA dehydrogenase NAD-binding domain-containing protein, partial [Pseudomonadota bacterium]
MSQYQKIGVVGAGTMGAGIAQLAASFGHSVVLFDVVDGAADEAVSRIAAGLDRLVARGKKTQTYRDTCVENIQVATSLAAFKDCGLVIEAIVEGLDIKHELFKQLEAIVDTSTVLASNTSSISITAIANTTQNPKRVVGMHFFNPAPVMKLVEVIAGLKTDSSVAKSIYDLAESWGKQPILA